VAVLLVPGTHLPAAVVEYHMPFPKRSSTFIPYHLKIGVLLL